MAYHGKGTRPDRCGRHVWKSFVWFINIDLVDSMRSAVGFVDPTVHFRRPYWKRKDLTNSDQTAQHCSKIGWALEGEIVADQDVSLGKLDFREMVLAQECAWSLGSEFGEKPEEIVTELHRRHSEMPRWYARMNERVRFISGRHVCDVASHYFHAANFFRALLSRGIIPPLRRLINVGSNDGIYQGDPFQYLYSYSDHMQWVVAVEMEPALCEAHKQNFPNVTMICKAIRPDTLEQDIMPELTNAAGYDGMPADILKIDIDSYDCDLAVHFFQLGVQPKFIIMEVNVNVPPPFKFKWVFNEKTLNVPLHNSHRDWNWMYPIFGCSLSAQVAEFAPFGYKLIFFWEGDAIFAHESQLPLLYKGQVIRGPLDEYDCFQKVLLATNGVDLRTMRRWLHEIALSNAHLEVASYLRHVYEVYIRDRLLTNISDLPYSLYL